jgi:hypothetical protein
MIILRNPNEIPNNLHDDLKEYIITCKSMDDLESFYAEMENRGGSITIPDRDVPVHVRRPMSQNTHYMLTGKEAYMLKSDPRIFDVQDAEFVKSTLSPNIRRTGGKYTKTTYTAPMDSTYRNWALLRCAERRKIYASWGDGIDGGSNPPLQWYVVQDWGDPTYITNANRTGSFDLNYTGKNVDVIIMDGISTVPDHPEFAKNADGTGESRYVEYDWFKLNSIVADNQAGDGVEPYTPPFYGDTVVGFINATTGTFGSNSLNFRIKKDKSIIRNGLFYKVPIILDFYYYNGTLVWENFNNNANGGSPTGFLAPNVYGTGFDNGKTLKLIAKSVEKNTEIQSAYCYGAKEVSYATSNRNTFYIDWTNLSDIYLVIDIEAFSDDSFLTKVTSQILIQSLIGKGPNNGYYYRDGIESSINANHGTHTSGVSAGNSQGWASDANIYQISPFGYNNIDPNLVWDYVRAFHANKEVNPVTQRRNPTIVNCSFGSSILPGLYGYGFGYKGIVRGLQINGSYNRFYLNQNQLIQLGMFNTYYSGSVDGSGFAICSHPYYNAAAIADIQKALDEGIIIVAASGNDSFFVDKPDTFKYIYEIYANQTIYDIYKDTLTINPVILNGTTKTFDLHLPNGYDINNIAVFVDFNRYFDYTISGSRITLAKAPPSVLEIDYYLNKDDMPGVDFYNSYTTFNGTNSYDWNQHKGTAPAAVPDVVTVGAIDAHTIETRAFYSNTGPGVDIYAPGTFIVSAFANINGNGYGDVVTDPRNSNYYIGRDVGTSMASPQVTGILACLMEIYPNMTPKQAKEIIQKYSTDSIFQPGDDAYSSVIPSLPSSIWFSGGQTGYHVRSTGSQTRQDVYNGILSGDIATWGRVMSPYYLNGGPNKFLGFPTTERPSSGEIYPKANYMVRPSSGILFPRTSIKLL